MRRAERYCAKTVHENDSDSRDSSERIKSEATDRTEDNSEDAQAAAAGREDRSPSS